MSVGLAAGVDARLGSAGMVKGAVGAASAGGPNRSSALLSVALSGVAKVLFTPAAGTVLSSGGVGAAISEATGTSGAGILGVRLSGVGAWPAIVA